MTESIRRRSLARAVWLLATLAVMVGSLLPAGSSPMLALSRFEINDRLMHFAAYAVLAFLPALHERWKFIVVAAVGFVALGIGLEFGQLWSPGRMFEIADVVADTLGICVGIAVAAPLRSSGVVRSLLCASRD